MADSSFDIVSKVDHQEVANAVNQAAKEIGTRYDFRNVGARVELTGEVIKMAANTPERCEAVLDVLQTKLVKRGVSLKHLDYSNDGEPSASGKEYRLEAALTSGISSENAKKISKIIRDEGPKSVKSSIQGEELRVTSKSRDDLQELQRLLKAKGDDLDVALQFTNYR
ncbi:MULTISPECIES: YajQ family cyclic di-GMP-binding protein [unclassified Serinicoccus]|uniref:YajQ family cyclic di-GMP-binding protein n=1 Tax=unclassified Serinicoccus TaxID=2643101 RepID=UPI0038539CF9